MNASRKDVEIAFKKIKVAFLPFFSETNAEEDLLKAKTLVLNFIKTFTRPDKQKELLGYYNAAFEQLGPKIVYGIISSVYEIIMQNNSQ